MDLFYHERTDPRLQRLRGTQACISQGELEFVPVYAEEVLLTPGRGGGTLQELFAPQDVMEREMELESKGSWTHLTGDRGGQRLRDIVLAARPQPRPRSGGPGRHPAGASRPLAGSHHGVLLLLLAFASAVPVSGNPSIHSWPSRLNAYRMFCGFE